MENLSSFWLWGILCVLFLILEFYTTGFYVFWYAPASLISMSLQYMGYSTVSQWMALFIFGNVFFLIHYHLQKGKGVRQKHFIPTNADQYIGKEAVLVEQVKKQPNTWRVVVERQTWLAVFDVKDSNELLNLEAEQKKEILRIEGNKLVLKY